MHTAIDIPADTIKAYCERWLIRELSLFGSVLRQDFGPSSDVDVLITFAPDAQWGLLDLVAMKQNLAEILRHDVDLVEEKCLRNPFRRKDILGTREVIYAA